MFSNYKVNSSSMWFKFCNASHMKPFLYLLKPFWKKSTWNLQVMLEHTQLMRTQWRNIFKLGMSSREWYPTWINLSKEGFTCRLVVLSSCHLVILLDQTGLCVRSISFVLSHRPAHFKMITWFLINAGLVSSCLWCETFLKPFETFLKRCTSNNLKLS
jgi:hypothetical protein